MGHPADSLTPDERQAILDVRTRIRHWLALDHLDRDLFKGDPENDFYQALGLIQRIKEAVAPLRTGTPADAPPDHPSPSSAQK